MIYLVAECLLEDALGCWQK